MHIRRTAIGAGAGMILVLATGLAACSGTGAPTPTPSPMPSTPAPTPRPTPTPVVANVTSPADAAAIVIASNPLFAGTIELKPDIIGASRWWKAEPMASGGYRIQLTIGWGDCPSGCIDRHVWTFDVDPAGGLKLVSETGDPVPSPLPR